MNKYLALNIVVLHSKVLYLFPRKEFHSKWNLKKKKCTAMYETCDCIENYIQEVFFFNVLLTNKWYQT